MNIDPSKIEQQLATARDARDHLDRVIDWLEQGVDLFSTAPAPAELPSPAATTADDQAHRDRRGGGFVRATRRASARACRPALPSTGAAHAR